MIDFPLFKRLLEETGDLTAELFYKKRVPHVLVRLQGKDFDVFPLTKLSYKKLRQIRARGYWARNYRLQDRWAMAPDPNAIKEKQREAVREDLRKTLYKFSKGPVSVEVRR